MENNAQLNFKHMCQYWNSKKVYAKFVAIFVQNDFPKYGFIWEDKFSV